MQLSSSSYVYTFTSRKSLVDDMELRISSSSRSLLGVTLFRMFLYSFVLASITWPVTQRTSQLSSRFNDDKDRKKNQVASSSASKECARSGSDHTPQPLQKFLLPNILWIVKDLWSERWLFVPATAKHLSTIPARCPHFKREKKELDGV